MRLIDADALIEYLTNRYMSEIFPDWRELPLDVREKICLLGITFKQEILNTTTIEAEPVRHGHWERSPYGLFTCSACGVNDRFGLSRYCSNCGARMYGGTGNGEQ